MPANAVVVQKPYMMIGAALLGLLVVAVGVLAFVELRRPAGVAPAAVPAQTQTTATAESSAAAAPSTSLSTATPPATTTTPAVAAPAPGVATTSAPTSPAAATPASDASPTPSTARAVSRPVGGDDSAPAPTPRPARSSAASAAAPPAVADVPQSFGNIKTVMLEGTKEREMDALLALEGGNLIVRSRDSGTVLKTMPYKAVAAATYTHARRPRSRDASAGVAVVPENLGGGGFLGSAKNWLTVQSKTDYLILRLDEDKNVQVVLSAIETRTGTKVDQVN